MATPEQALTELTELSTQVHAATIFDRDGKVAASTLVGGRGDWLASSAKALLDAAESLRGEGDTAVVQLEAATPEGSVLVVREGDRVVAAVTGPEPTAGLVFYDLKRGLQSVSEEKPKPKRKRAPAKSGPSRGSR
jgi:predicted regulator of Ras-like GTPase activity (Roadblock/LC7/MglB family)